MNTCTFLPIESIWEDVHIMNICNGQPIDAPSSNQYLCGNIYSGTQGGQKAKSITNTAVSAVIHENILNSEKTKPVTSTIVDC